MSEKRLRALAYIVATLTLLWVVIALLPGGGGGGSAPPGTLSGFFRGVEAETVSTVRVVGPGGGDSLELSRRLGEWTVNGYRADSGSVARFWDAMGKAEVRDLIGSNPENHPRFGLDPDSAWSLELVAGEKARRLLIGKAGNRYGTAYVRLPEEDPVYLLHGGLRSSVTRDLEGWRNKRVASLDTAGVGRIEGEGEEGRFALVRVDSVWALEGVGPADAVPVRSLLGELARLDATGFFPGEGDLPPRGGWLRALGPAGDTLLYLELGSGEGDRWVRAAGDSTTYKLSSWRAGRLMPNPETLEDKG